MAEEGTILHADADSFYASVEQRDDPSLRGRPVIVGGGVVLAASYEAKAYGVRTPMGGGQARRMCPNAVVISPRMSAYSEASKAVFAVFDDTTPLVEGLSIGEVARLAQPTLVSMLGLASGRHLHALAHNHDPRPVQVGKRRGSIGSQHAIGWRPKSDEDIDATAVAIVDRVTRRMRAAGRVGRTVVLRMRFNDSTRATRSHTLARATAQTETVLRAVRALLRSAQPLIDAQA